PARRSARAAAAEPTTGEARSGGRSRRPVRGASSNGSGARVLSSLNGSGCRESREEASAEMVTGTDQRPASGELGFLERGAQVSPLTRRPRMLVESPRGRTTDELSASNSIELTIDDRLELLERSRPDEALSIDEEGRC